MKNVHVKIAGMKNAKIVLVLFGGTNAYITDSQNIGRRCQMTGRTGSMRRDSP